MHKKIADLFGSFIKSAYICIINKGDKLTSSPLSKFEIVFSSLYKFCEGMFRRETVHSHFFVHFSPFPVFSAPHCVVCTLHRRFFRASGARCGGVFSPLCRAVRSPAVSPCAFRFVTKGEVRHRRELACGVWKGGCPSFFCFPSSCAKSRAPG